MKGFLFRTVSNVTSLLVFLDDIELYHDIALSMYIGNSKMLEAKYMLSLGKILAQHSEHSRNPNGVIIALAILRAPTTYL